MLGIRQKVLSHSKIEFAHQVVASRRKMTPEEREKMNDLCKQIQTEKNPEVFDQLVRELNDLIEIKHERIHPEHKATPN